MTAYLKSKQLLPSGFALWNTWLARAIPSKQNVSPKMLQNPLQCVHLSVAVENTALVERIRRDPLGKHRTPWTYIVFSLPLETLFTFSLPYMTEISVVIRQ